MARKKRRSVSMHQRTYQRLQELAPALAKERRRQARLEKVEARVTELEVQLESISAQLANPSDNPDVIVRLGDDYVEIQNELDALIVEWEQLHS